MEYHVMKQGNDNGEGTLNQPFLTISRAANQAIAGDKVIVHSGVYREWINPKNGGTKDNRIIYQSAGDGEVIITGAEPVAEWKFENHNVWSTEVSNQIYSQRNPFETELSGDWVFGGPFQVHLGDLYLNGNSMYECEGLQAVLDPKIWPDAKYSEDSLLKWFAEVDSKTTKIWANFASLDPRKECVEISVRPHCFWPEKPGLNYITVRGFTMCKAAPKWAPPTDYQEGLIGPHWSKGWIIEDNHISDSKCVGISLGTKIGTGHYMSGNNHIKGGTQREQEVIFKAINEGWHKDKIGSHIIRRNVIHDCEQAGIVGHMGAAFSQIYENKIYNIHHKRLRHGAEVAGIKLHAALDSQIFKNTIFGCYRGIWLDWQAQGTRISRNVFFDNLSEDFFVEVCHGPYMVDHNLFLSPMNFRNMAQGGAFVHNLFAGRFVIQSEVTRTTPYHVPHGTAVAGYSNITSGDDRYYNNLFCGDGQIDETPIPITFFEHLPLKARKQEGIDGKAVMDGVPEDAICQLYNVGIGGYNKHPNVKDKQLWDYTPEELSELGDLAKDFIKGNGVLPVAMDGNLYLNNASPSSHEDRKRNNEEGLKIKVNLNNGTVEIRIIEPHLLQFQSPKVITSEILGKTYHAQMLFEEPDGRPYCFDLDFHESKRPQSNVTPGPFEITGDKITISI